MTSTTVVKASPQIAINDIGSEEELLAAIDATIKHFNDGDIVEGIIVKVCLLYTSPSPRDRTRYRMPSSA